MNKRVLIGNKMSNVFFNWSQHDRFTPEERSMMKDLQTQWDESRPTKRAADLRQPPVVKVKKVSGVNR